MVVKIITLFALLLLVGCSYLPPFPYKIDVQQGNVVDEEMVGKLKLGMTKSQVRFVLGSPLIVDAFRNDRWDYVYVQQEKGKLVEKERLTVFFEDEQLIEIKDYLLPSTASPELVSEPGVEAGAETETASESEPEPVSETETETETETVSEPESEPEPVSSSEKEITLPEDGAKEWLSF